MSCIRKDYICLVLNLLGAKKENARFIRYIYKQHFFFFKGTIAHGYSKVLFGSGLASTSLLCSTLQSTDYSIRLFSMLEFDFITLTIKFCYPTVHHCYKLFCCIQSLIGFVVFFLK